MCKSKDELLNEAKKYLEEACDRAKSRKQKSLMQKAAKYLAEVYRNKEDMENTLKYYSISISEGSISTFDELLKNEKQDDYITRCEDIEVLNNFSQQILDSIRTENRNTASKRTLCLKLLNKLKKECAEKEKLWDSERAERRKEEIELDKECADPQPLENENSFKECYEILTGKKQGGGKRFLTGKQIKARLDINETSFDKILYGRKSQVRNGSLAELIILRRWNSFSPGLSKKYAVSLGGGYLLRIYAPKFQEKNNNYQPTCLESEKESTKWFNIVIDPGYNFLLNFQSEDFSIEDIDAVAVTHSHPDHCAELSAIMDLMVQINKRQQLSKNKKKIYLLLSRGVYKKFSPYIQDWKDQLKDVLILSNHTRWPQGGDEEFEIESINTAHADLGGERAVGIIVKMRPAGNTFGFTGDTPWRKYVRDFFRNCDVLCLHMGSLKTFEIGFDKNGQRGISAIPDCDDQTREELRKRIKKEIRETNHLLFYGSRDIITNCKQTALVLVGEFGEELKYGLRTDLVNKLSFSASPQCIPADTGLYLSLTPSDRKIRCDFCGDFVFPKDINIFSYGIIDSLHYVCEACDNTLTESQKRTIIDYKLTKH